MGFQQPQQMHDQFQPGMMPMAMQPTEGQTWDNRWTFAQGKMQIQTEHPYYEPGSMVVGKIYLMLSAPVAAQSISLIFKAKERAQFFSFREDEELVKHSKETRYRQYEVSTYRRTNKMQRVFMNGD